MKYITNNTIAAYITKLNAKKYGHAELVKKVLTVTSFIDWLSKENKVSKDDAKRFSEQLLKITHTQPVTKPSLNNLPNKGKFPLRFVGYILIALTVSILGAGIYNRFFLKVKTPLAYSTTPIQAGRTISFQGRLTDSLGNPITAPIDITYNFYTTATGGIPITGSTRVCTANGDVDGVFSSLIGNDAGPSCNTELPASIFTENPTVYLGVKVGSEPNEMSPRQQIANVGYAINAETLQGMPPGQSTSSVPFINKDGDLLVAVSNPGIRSTFASANFTISSAQATTIQSAGSGDITLSATQGGALRFNTYYGTLGERMTILANGNVGIGNTTPSMALDIVGSATTSGNLSSGGQVKLGELTSAPTSLGAGSLYYNSTTAKVYYNNGTVWTEVGAGAAGSDLFQRTLGSLAPTNITDAINTGAIATGSALVHLPGTNNQNAWFNLGLGNLGIGTITPTNYVEIQGNTTGTGGTGSVLKIVQNGTWTGNSPYALDVSGYTNLNGFRINAADGVRALYKTAAGGSLGFATTGDDPITFTQSTSTERMRIAAGGNVGIGTTVPGAKLDVLGNLNVSTYATVGASLALGTSTAAPGAGNLDMSGNLTFAGALRPGGNAGTSGQFLTSGGPGAVPAWTSTIAATSLPFSGITSATNTTAAMVVGNGASLNYTGTGTINASSLIGGTWAAPGAIGTTTPAAANFTTIGATTQGTGKFTTLEATSTGNALTLSGAGANIAFSGAGLAQITTATNQHLALMPAGTGNVGVGTNAPTAKLQVVGSANAKQLVVKGYSTQTANLQEWQDSTGTVMASVDKDGYLTTNNIQAPTSGTVQVNSLGGTSYLPYMTDAYADQFVFKPLVSLEYDTDGLGTWVAQTTSLANVLLDNSQATTLSIPAATAKGFRTVINAGAWLAPQLFVLEQSWTSGTPSGSAPLDITLESSPDNVTWTTRKATTSFVYNGSSTNKYLWLSGGHVGDAYWRVTVERTDSGTEALTVFNIKLLASSNMMFGYVRGLPFESNYDKSLNFNGSTMDVKLKAGQTLDAFRIKDSNNNALFNVNNIGNVGIGITSPAAKLDVNGNLNVNTYATVSASLALGTSNASAGAGNLDMSGNLTFAGAFKPAGNAGTTGQFLISGGAGAAPTWTSTITATSIPFSGITSGTNTTAAMVVGNGASLNYTGTGTINASSLIGGTWAAPGAIGGTTANTGAFTTLSASSYATVSASLALGTSTAAAGAGNLSMSGNLNLAGAFMPGGTAGTSGQYLTSAGPGATPTWTSTVGASTVPFSGITNGTNTTAAMVVGAGGSLNYTSTGTINASTLIGGTWAAPGAIGGTTANTGKFTTLEATSTGNALTLSGVGANIAFSGAGLAQITTATNQHLALMPAGTGNVGVGKSAPTAKLDVLGNLNVSTYATMGASLALGTSNASAGAGNLDMSGNLTLSGAFKPAGNAGTAGYFLASSGTGSAPTWTSTIGASTVPFSGITGPSTNTTAAMTVGTGASLNYTGTGTINASSLIGGTWAAPGAIGTTTPAAANFTTIGATTQGTGKFTTLEATSTGNALTLSGAGANIAFSGAGLAQITTATNQHLALMPAGTGNVGIGTTSPGAKLQVEGDTRVRGNDVFFSLQNTAGGSDWHLRSYNDGSFAIRQQTGGPYDRLTVLNTGNVGIGATSPTAKLDILGNLNVSTYATVGASLALGTSNAAAGAGNLDMSGNLTIAGAIKPGGNAGASGYILTSSGGGVNTWTDPLTLTGGANVWQRVLGSLAPLNITDDVNIGNTATGSALVHLPGTNNQNAWFNLGTGNLGVGTASPSFKFEVNSGSDVSVANFKSTSASNQAAIWLQNTTGGISLLGEGSVFSITDDSFGKKFNVDVSTGNVGIGTTNLTSLLSIGSTNITANPQIAIGTDLAESNYAISVSGGRTMFGYDQIDGSSVINSGGSKGFKVMVNGTNNSWLSGTQAFTVASDGNVGIGVSNPTSKLEIAGASSTISNASGDIAINAASGNVSFSTNNLTNITNLTTLGQVRIGQFSTPPVSIGAGSLYYNSTGGKIYYNNGAAWVEVGASFWQQTLGSLAPTNITNDINTGSTATASALVHLPGTTNHNAWLNLGTGNVGIGTTTPTSAKLQVNGTIMGDELIDTAGGGAYYVDPAGTSVLGGNVYIASTYGVDTTAAGTLYLGNTNSSVIAIGTSATARTLTLGNTTGATALALNSGTGGITLNSTDVIDLNSSKAAGGGATEAFSLKTSTDLGATDELFQLGDSLADMITVLGNGYVGIGTSTPGTQLQVHEPGTGNSQLTVSTDSDTNNSILAFTTDANGTPKDARIGLDSANGVLKMVYGSPFASSTNGLVINSSGNIGIGTVNPLDQVEIANTVVGGRMIISNGAGATRKTLLFQAPGGTYNYARLTAHDYGASTGINLALQDTGGNVGIGTTTPTGAKLQVVGAVMADQFTDTTGSGTYYMNPAGTSVLGGNIEMRSATPSILGYDSSTTTYYTLHFKGNSGDAVASISVDGATSGSGKIDVGTVDPPYTIDGKKYATYQPSMTGVKEETTGVAHLTQKNSQLQAYTYTIDFNNQTEGSDLWLFNKTSNLKQNIKDMTVLLSSASNGKTWYNVDKDSQQLTFFSSSPTDISYRLTAPRFDSSTWKNERDANDPSVGFVINSDGTLSSPNTTQVAYTAPQLTQYANNTFALVGDFIDEFINVNKALIANIKSGFIEAEDIVINNTLTARETLTSSLTASVARIETLVVSKKINTPSVETVDLKASGSSELPSISTNTVKPIEKDVTVDLSKNSSPSGSLARLVINGLNNAPVAQIDAAGNATLAGTLVADQVVASSSAFGSSSIAQLKTDNASVSGTLIAKEVQADNINNSLQQFSSSINGVQQQLAALQNAPLPNAQYYQKLDDSIIGNITITDTANIYKATISDSLMVGSVLVEQNSLLALSSDLKISSLSTIHLFDDVVVIAKNGNVAIKGEVSASSLAIKNVEGTTVASVDASGSAHFNEVIAKKFTLDKIATNGAVIADSGMRNAQNEPIPAIKTDAEVAGTGSIPQDAKEVVIYNDNVTENSLIYLTPTSDTVQNQLSVTKKTTCSANTTQTACTPYFVISSNSAIHPEAPFNWLIIN